MTVTITHPEPKSIVSNIFHHIDALQRQNHKITSLKFRIFSQTFVSISAKDSPSFAFSLRKDAISAITGDVECLKSMTKSCALQIIHTIFSDVQKSITPEHSLVKIISEFTIISTKDKCVLSQALNYKFSAHPGSKTWIDAIYKDG